MEKITEALGIGLLAIIIIFVLAIISGTILWVLYPHLLVLFPSAVKNGVLTSDLSWWDSVCITWIAALFRSSYNNSKKEE